MALEFGSSSLKVVEVNYRQDKVELEDFVVKRWDKSLIKETGFDFNRAKGILQRIFKKNKFSTPNLSLVLSGREIILKILVLPKVGREELANLLLWEVEDRLKAPREDLVFDYKVLSEEEDKMKVLLAITNKKRLLKQISLLEQLGFKVTKVNAASLVFKNLLNTKLRAKKVAIINIGAQETVLTILACGKFSFRRIIPLGGADITDEIKTRTGLTYKEAKKWKESSQFNSITELDTLDKLIDKINLSIHYWSQQGKEIEQLLLTGGGVKLNGLRKTIAKELRIKVQFLTGLSQFEVETKNFSKYALKESLPYLAVSLAGTLRGEN